MFNILKKTGDGNKIVSIPVDLISQNPDQPRKYFDENAMEELKNSIREFGLIQPVTVRRCGSEYELVTGERRFRACCALGYKKIPSVIINTNSQTSALLSLLENLHREDLSFFEIAQSYENLIRNKGITENEAAFKTGRTKMNILNKMRLLKLSPFVKKLVREYNLSENHARALLRISDEKKQLEAARSICLNHLNLRQTYDLIDSMLENEETPDIHRPLSDTDMSVFKNTVKRSLNIVKKGGVDAQMQEKSFDWGTEYIIKIKDGKIKDEKLPDAQVTQDTENQPEKAGKIFS